MAADPGLSPWRIRRFRWFAAGNTVNNVGEAIYDIALPLLIYAETGSVVIMAFVAALTPATLLLGPVLGAVADARGAGRLVLSGLTVQLGAAVLLSVLVTADTLDVAAVIVLATILQVAGATYRVGWMTGVPGMFPETPVRARGTLSSLFVATTIIGPVLVGALLPWLGYAGLLWLNCLSFVAPLVVFAAGIRPVTKRVEDIGRSEVWTGLVVGLQVLRDVPTLRRLTLLLLPFEFVASAATPTLALYHLRDTLGISATVVAAVFAVMNVAALAGALTVSERKVFRPVFVVNAITVLVALALFGAAVPVIAVVVGALVLLMFLDGAASSAQSMLMVHYIPEEVFGRASGVLRLIHGVPAVLGPLAVAGLVPLLGTRAVFVALGVVTLASVVGLGVLKKKTSSKRNEMEKVEA